MPSDRTSGGDPARTLALLWRAAAAEPARAARRGSTSTRSSTPRSRSPTSEGLAAVTMRALAARLGVSAMTLYGYVPGKDELLDLMLDALYARMPRPPWRAGSGWRARARAVAEANRALYAAHPWAAAVSTARPPLGPGLMAKYEHELAALRRRRARRRRARRRALVPARVRPGRGRRRRRRGGRAGHRRRVVGGRRPAARARVDPGALPARGRASAPRPARPTAPRTTPRTPTRSGSSGCSTASPP